jgi:ribosomal protein S14
VQPDHGSMWRYRQGELRRIPILGTGVKIALAAAHFHGFGVARQAPWITWVNKVGTASSEARSDYTSRCRRCLRVHGLLLLAMLAREVLRAVHNDHHDRHHAPQR